MANPSSPIDETTQQTLPLAQIYHRLKLGTGHELVNDANVQELIQIAHGYGDELVETLLREWGAVGSATAHPGPP